MMLPLHSLQDLQIFNPQICFLTYADLIHADLTHAKRRVEIDFGQKMIDLRVDKGFYDILWGFMGF